VVKVSVRVVCNPGRIKNLRAGLVGVRGRASPSEKGDLQSFQIGVRGSDEEDGGNLPEEKTRVGEGR
jgi:hypothetical protein